MQTITDIKEMQARCLAARAAGQTVAFVPTMGYLHEGHLSLLREGRRRGDLLVLSIFVNPTQFGQGEDLGRYPRDFDRDQAMAAECNVDLIFYPDTAAVYPHGYVTYVNVEGPLTTTLKGACRPTHFRGVTTVVAKLLNIVLPHVALFGRKDFQQLAVIRRMTADLNLPVEIVGMPIVREDDGLAMSSRNQYLTAQERQRAPVLYRTLCEVAARLRNGESCFTALESGAAQTLRNSGFEPDYVAIRNALTLEVPAGTGTAPQVVLAAARLGKARLIDNMILN